VTAAFVFRENARQILPRDKLGGSPAHDLGCRPGNFAANGVEEFLP